MQHNNIKASVLGDNTSFDAIAAQLGRHCAILLKLCRHNVSRQLCRNTALAPCDIWHCSIIAQVSIILFSN